MERERLGSRLGFILLSAGCAIGVGNVWKFPYVTGENGGGIFVLIYLVFLVIMGIPILSMEFSMGRSARKSPVKMYQQLRPDKKAFKYHGYVMLIGNIVLMMFYTSVTGWMLCYFVYMLTGKFSNVSGELSKDFIKAEKILAFNGPLMQMTIYTCIIAISFLGAQMIVQSGNTTFTTGDLTSMFTYTTQILGGLMMLSMVFVMITMSRAPMERCADF